MHGTSNLALSQPNRKLFHIAFRSFLSLWMYSFFSFWCPFSFWVDCGSVFNGHFCIHWIRINRIPNAGNYNAGRVLHIHQAIKISYNERPKENRRGRDREGWHTYIRYKLDIVQCAMPKININHVIFRVVYVRLVSVCATRPIDTMHALFFCDKCAVMFELTIRISFVSVA